MRRFAALVVWTLAVIVTNDAVAQEKIETPLYKSWSGHPVGTVIVVRERTVAKTQTIETVTTTRLVELNGEKAVVETIVKSNSTGETIENDPQTFEYRRYFLLPAGAKANTRPKDVVAEGEEEIEAVGRKFRAKWRDAKGQTEAGESLTRSWMSEEVPGLIVKAVTRVPKIGKETTIELVELRRP